MTITMTKDLNPPTPFLFPGVGEQASQSWPRGRRIAALSKTGQLGAPRFPFLAGRAPFLFSVCEESRT
jgi:hypothetical protein